MDTLPFTYVEQIVGIHGKTQSYLKKNCETNL
jgi:hypothetical protein